MTKSNATIAWQASKDPAGQVTREFSLRQDGARPVTGAIWLPAQPQPGRPLVLFGHGASGDRYQRPIPHLAQRFCSEAGLAVLSIDGPVHGLRQVGPGGRAAFAQELKRVDCISDMVSDWQQAIEQVRALDAVGRGPLAYFGLSMGSMFGIPLIAAREDVAVATLGLLGTAGPSGPLRERFLTDAAAITCPLLFLMQLEDELFDRPGYLELFDAFGAKDKRLHANPGLHPEIPQEEIDFAFDFMRAHLEGRARRRIIDPLAQ
jgi:alpha-beta hydrolase superfamily lysophospholipase